MEHASFVRRARNVSLITHVPLSRYSPPPPDARPITCDIQRRDIGVDYCIFRPCGLNDDWSPNQRPIFSQGDVAVGRINRMDVAKILVDVLSTPEATGRRSRRSPSRIRGGITPPPHRSARRYRGSCRTRSTAAGGDSGRRRYGRRTPSCSSCCRGRSRTRRASRWGRRTSSSTGTRGDGSACGARRSRRSKRLERSRRLLR